MVFFATMIDDLGINGLLCDYDWRLGNCWVSSSALREYEAIHKIYKCLCICCVDYTPQPIHEHSMDVPRTQYGHSTDIVQAFCGHGVDDIYAACHAAIHWLRNGIPWYLTDFRKLLVTCTLLYCNFIPVWKEYRFCP